MILYTKLNELHLGPFKFYLYGLMATIAIVLGLFILLNESKRRKLNLKNSLYLYLWIIIGIFIGARLFHIMGPWHHGNYTLLERLYQFVTFSSGGLVMYGGLIFGILFGFSYLKIKRVNFWLYADILAPAAAIGLFFGRIGCFFAACCQVKSTNLPWAIVKDGTPSHPAMIYAALFSLFLFIFLLEMRRRKQFEGEVFLWYIVLYPIGRFFLEIPRYYSTLYFGLSASQIISIVLIIVFAPLFIKRYSTQKRQIKDKIEKIDIISYAYILAGGFIISISAYIASAWGKVLFFLLFILGLAILLVGIRRVYASIKLSEFLHLEKWPWFIKIVLISVAIIAIFLSVQKSSIKAIGDTFDSENNKNCPSQILGNIHSNVKIKYFESPYCPACWKEELLAFPPLFRNMNSSFHMEKYDIRYCKNETKKYAVFGTPTFVFQNIDTSKEFVHYGYYSYNELRKMIKRLKNLE